MRNFNLKVEYIVYIEEFENGLIEPYFYGKENIIIQANNIYEAEYKAIEIVRKKARCNNRFQINAVDNNEIYFNVKMIF